MLHVSVQHSQMLVVRKEGKAHDRYNSFRSAFELLESVGREPGDCFEEHDSDMIPLQRLELRMQEHMQRKIDKMQQQMQKQIDNLKEENLLQQQQIDDLKNGNGMF